MSQPNKNNRIANQIKRVLGISFESQSNNNSSTMSESNNDPPRTVSRSTSTVSFLLARANAQAAAAAASSGNSTSVLTTLVTPSAVGYATDSTAGTSNTQAIVQRSTTPTPTPDTSNLEPPKGKEVIASLFECPVCFELILPPIYQCQNGHVLCIRCRGNITYCPLCRSPMPSNIRNLQLEKLAEQFPMRCSFQEYGCKAMLIFGKERTDHESECVFRSFPCPCPSGNQECTWTGILQDVVPHLFSRHQSITTLEGMDIVFLATDINLSGAVDWVMIQACFDHHFMLVLEKQERSDGYTQFFAVVQMLGNEGCENFLYRLELANQKRRLMWEGHPQPIGIGFRKAISNSDCLMFDTKMADHFSEGGNLAINVSILKAPISKESTKEEKSS